MQRKIAFVGAHDLMLPYIEYSAIENDVYLYESGSFLKELSPEVILIPLKKTLGLFKFLVRGETSAPWRMRGLQKELRRSDPDIIFVLDFIRMWYWQVLWYKFWHPRVRLILYSETQRVPLSSFSRLAFYVFLSIYKATKGVLSEHITFTDLGEAFVKKFSGETPVSVLPAPVDTKVFKTNNDKAYIKGGILRVLINARYVAYKKHEDIFEAVARNVVRGQTIQVTCIGRLGGQENIVRKYAKESGVAHLVTFLPPTTQENLVGIYQDHDVLVLVSDNEAIGMVVPEAMACGLPTITSDTVGANVYVVPEKTGFIVETRSVAGLSNALSKLNIHRCQEMGEAARNHIEKFASYEASLALYAKLLKRICQNS